MNRVIKAVSYRRYHAPIANQIEILGNSLCRVKIHARKLKISQKVICL